MGKPRPETSVGKNEPAEYRKNDGAQVKIESKIKLERSRRSWFSSFHLIVLESLDTLRDEVTSQEP